jgi:hypothetical protein
MKKYKFVSRKKQKNFYTTVVVSLYIVTAFAVHGALEAINTADAYTYEEAISNEDMEKNENMYLNAEEDIFQPAYMNTAMIDSLGVEVGDVIDLPEVGKVIVKNIESMRQNVIVLQSKDIEINSKELDLHKYVKVNGGN